MRFRNAFVVSLGASLCLLTVAFAQKPFKEYDALEYSGFALPNDYKQPAEWTRARLKYPDGMERFYGRSVYWTMDYPRADRHFLQGIRRLTRVDTRSVEQVVELDLQPTQARTLLLLMPLMVLLN